MTTSVLDIPATGIAQRSEVRRDAWTILGTSVEGATSTVDALRRADMYGWNVRKLSDVTATELTNDGTTNIALRDTWANVRTNPITGAVEHVGSGTVGKKYQPFQFEQHAEVLDYLHHEHGATFDKAGSYKHGARGFLTMRLPGSLLIGGVDYHDMHLAAFFAHDGSAADSLHLGLTRVLCGNMQNLIVRGAKRSFTIKNMSGAQKRLSEVRAEVENLFAYQAAFAAEADRMLNTPLTLGQFERVAEQLWPLQAAPSKRTQRNHDQRMTVLRTLFTNADTQANIRGTVWAGWNAIGEYMDHYAPARSENTRAARSLTETARKSRARDLLTLAA